MTHWFKTLIAFLVVALVAGCGGNDAPLPPGNVVQVAQADPQFSVLVEAVTAADLADTLSGPGPFTVFAPTNDAFTALITELGTTKEALLANKALLTQVLTYHVLPAKVLKADIPLGKPITTVEGDIFKIDAPSASSVQITDGRNRVANVTATDIPASNGVVHVIDKVLLPPNLTVVGTAQANPDFSILVEALTAAGLVDTLNGAGKFTVFAPTNEAFAALLTELGITKEALLADTALLTKVLTYHVVSGEVLKADVPIGAPISTLEGETFTVDSSLTITDQRGRSAAITATDILASNGVVHVLDKVLLPSP